MSNPFENTSYNPSEEEIKRAESMMSPEERAMSKVRQEFYVKRENKKLPGNMESVDIHEEGVGRYIGRYKSYEIEASQTDKGPEVRVNGQRIEKPEIASGIYEACRAAVELSVTAEKQAEKRVAAERSETAEFLELVRQALEEIELENRTQQQSEH